MAWAKNTILDRISHVPTATWDLRRRYRGEIMVKQILAVVFFVIACGCTPVQISENHDTTVDFSTMKTYAWLNVNEPLSGDVRIDKNEVKRYVRDAVERVLLAKGYIKGAEEEADFLVTWLGGVEKKVSVKNIDHFYRPYGYSALQQDPRWRRESPLTQVEYQEGSLLLDFLDPASQKLVWRGVGKEQITGTTTSVEAERLISKVVSQILKTFPPEKK